MANKETGTRASNRTHRTALKPFTEAEVKAKSHGELHLVLANLFMKQGDRESASRLCRIGLRLICGISRPLAVRDQLHDLLLKLNDHPCQPDVKIAQAGANLPERR